MHTTPGMAIEALYPSFILGTSMQCMDLDSFAGAGWIYPLFILNDACMFPCTGGGLGVRLAYYLLALMYICM
jgi:hypothetical protein